jgi:rare lipoprotein A
MGEYFLVATRSREVIVRINDIGPSRTNPDTKDRVIDLSEAAARRLGMKGVANVRVYRCS